MDCEGQLSLDDDYYNSGLPPHHCTASRSLRGHNVRGVYVRAVMGVFQGTPFLHPLFLPRGDSAAVLSGDSEARSSGMEEPRGWQFRRLLEPKVQWIRRLAS